MTECDHCIATTSHSEHQRCCQHQRRLERQPLICVKQILASSLRRFSMLYVLPVTVSK